MHVAQTRWAARSRGAAGEAQLCDHISEPSQLQPGVFVLLRALV